MSPFLLFSALHLALFLGTFSRYFSAAVPLNFLRLLLLSLAVDNAVVGIGDGNLDAQWYAWCTRLRYALHALVLPGLVPWGLSLLPRPLPRWLLWGSAMFVLGAIGYGAWHEIMALELGASVPGQPPRLVSTAPGPPLATVLGNLLFLCLAAVIWYRSRWPWAFAGGLLILLVNGAMAGQPQALVAGALAELVFIVSLLASESGRARILAAAVNVSKKGQDND
ncbi:hypothetical protein [Haliea sp. E17]|uniref:hypothetical protein n=1 Tax=Haliea sp. E17 TaxID=3401576 RepID=UPI003AB0E640